MNEITADGLLFLIREEPTILPPGPSTDEFPENAIETRVRDEEHPCLRCGNRAVVAYLAQTELGWRWLDLCAEDAQWLLSTMSNSWHPHPGDDQDAI